MTKDTAREDEVLLEVRDRIGIITLNAPGRMNTISSEMLNLMSEKLLAADQDPEVRCIVLTGAGKAFCAGLDMGAMSGRASRSAFSTVAESRCRER